MPQLGAMSEYIRKNARDFEVVILGVVDAIDIKDYTANQKDEVNYLVDYLGALRDQCAGFTFYGGLFLCFKFVYNFLFFFNRAGDVLQSS